MKRYRKFEGWLKDIRRDLTRPGKAASFSQLEMTMWGLADVIGQVLAHPERTLQLLEIGRGLRAQSGPGRIVAEERWWSAVVALGREDASILCEDDELAEDEQELMLEYPPEEREGESMSETRARETLLLLCDEVRLCYRFRRARDGFAVRRRAACFAVWMQAIPVLDLPDVFALAKQAVCNAKEDEATAAVVFLDACYRSRDVAPDDETPRDLQALIKRATWGGTVTAVLGLLVEAGLMFPETAYDARKEWEAQRYGRPVEIEDDGE